MAIPTWNKWPRIPRCRHDHETWIYMIKKPKPTKKRSECGKKRISVERIFLQKTGAVCPLKNDRLENNDDHFSLVRWKFTVLLWQVYHPHSDMCNHFHTEDKNCIHPTMWHLSSWNSVDKQQENVAVIRRWNSLLLQVIPMWQDNHMQIPLD